MEKTFVACSGVRYREQASGEAGTFKRTLKANLGEPRDNLQGFEELAESNQQLIESLMKNQEKQDKGIDEVHAGLQNSSQGSTMTLWKGGPKFKIR